MNVVAACAFHRMVGAEHPDTGERGCLDFVIMAYCIVHRYADRMVVQEANAEVRKTNGDLRVGSRIVRLAAFIKEGVDARCAVMAAQAGH